MPPTTSISRVSDMIARTHNQPGSHRIPDATIVDGRQRAVGPARLRCQARTVRVAGLDYRLDVSTLHRDKDRNGVETQRTGRVSLRTQVPLLPNYTTALAARSSQ